MYLGDTEITKVYLGDTEVQKMYLGDVLVYGGTQPTFTGITATYTTTSANENCKLSHNNSFLPVIDTMEIDGVDVTPVSAYTFDTAGDHTVRYTITGTVIPDGSFRACSALTNIQLPPYITAIGAYAFYNDYSFSNTFIDLPNVVSIGNYAFYYSYFSAISIGSGCTSIGSQAFLGSNSPTGADCGFWFYGTTPPAAQSNSFYYNTQTSAGTNRKIRVPSGCLASYQAATGFSDSHVKGYIIEM